MAGPSAVHEPDILPFVIGGLDRVGRARHTCYEIAFVTAGQGTHVVDLTAIELRPPMLCFAMPGQVRAWHGTKSLEGKLIVFAAEFLEAYPRDRDVWQGLRSTPLSRKEATAIAAVIREMEEEYQLRGPGCTAILQACLHILLLRASKLSCMRGTLPLASANKRRRHGSGTAAQPRIQVDIQGSAS